MFGERKPDFLRRFLPFANGTPSHDQRGLIFGALDATAFQTCFIAWKQRLSGAIAGVVAVDGKTLHRSFDRAGNQGRAAYGLGLEFGSETGAGRTRGGREIQRDRRHP